VTARRGLPADAPPAAVAAAEHNAAWAALDRHLRAYEAAEAANDAAELLAWEAGQ
jgi:hypothetical protein